MYTAIILIGFSGAIAAFILYFLSKKFEVKEDPRIAQTLEILPGVNCGGCGYPGCNGFAVACVKSETLKGLSCPVGGAELMKNIAKLLGQVADESSPKIAVIRCNGVHQVRPFINRYDGAPSCAISSMLYSGPTGCSFGCLGLGDCVDACLFDAISINQTTGLAEISEEKCVACGACVKACPKNIIEMLDKGPELHRIYVACANKDKGGIARKACQYACTGCMKCVKECPFEAVTMDRNLAYINETKCTLCRQCLPVCPTGAIRSLPPTPSHRGGDGDLTDRGRGEASPVSPSNGGGRGKASPVSPSKGGGRGEASSLTFKIGGIQPLEYKLSAGCQIQMIPLPETVVIPLDQHIGAPASAIVAKGDKVKAGARIGKAEGHVSTNIHSSVSGTVIKVDSMPDGFGIPHPAVFIRTEGDEWEPGIDCSETLDRDCNFSPAEIIEKIDAAGLVGMGGAGFPTKIKLTPRPGEKVEVLIINAAECEPYLTADHALMLEKSEEILVGASLFMKALNINRTIIGIEDNKPDAIKLLTGLSAGYKGIEVVSLKSRYPQGGEKQLIEALLHRQVKSGMFPVSIGVIVQNVATAFAVYEAVQKNKPLIERVVTVTGKNVVKPSNFLARIGTPINTLINATGGLPENTGKIINGGPMMGKAMINTDAPVTKGCCGIVLMTKEESLRRQKHDCIRCAKCVEACPMGLEPNLLMNLTEHKLWDDTKKNHITDCIECGACNYICPANRPLSDYLRLGKTTVLKAK